MVKKYTTQTANNRPSPLQGGELFMGCMQTTKWHHSTLTRDYLGVTQARSVNPIDDRLIRHQFRFLTGELRWYHESEKVKHRWQWLAFTAKSSAIVLYHYQWLLQTVAVGILWMPRNESRKSEELLATSSKQTVHPTLSYIQIQPGHLSLANFAYHFNTLINKGKAFYFFWLIMS